IPRHPCQSADPLIVKNRHHIFAHFASFVDRMLTPKHIGLTDIHPWDAAPGYMRWYFRISHSYMLPLPPGDPPRPCEVEALVEEEAEAEGPLA
ncbi:hypothetical protein A2U01_0068770, partial [Trifolium medium]|nr:hypothetical protein [Trifolium medium]